ncbi:SDR family NAD(P)-dependent oxidoreductase [Pyxidicoccus sp. 3LFB2]
MFDVGARVIATARNPQSIPLAPHPRLVVAKLDVTDEAEAQRVVAEAGRIDVLVNNAGFGLLGGVEEASAAEVEKLYRTNVFGLHAVTRAVLPAMRQQRSGHVINLSSVGGYRSSAGWGVYRRPARCGRARASSTTGSRATLRSSRPQCRGTRPPRAGAVGMPPSAGPGSPAATSHAGRGGHWIDRLAAHGHVRPTACFVSDYQLPS